MPSNNPNPIQPKISRAIAPSHVQSSWSSDSEAINTIFTLNFSIFKNVSCYSNQPSRHHI